VSVLAQETPTRGTRLQLHGLLPPRSAERYEDFLSLYGRAPRSTAEDLLLAVEQSGLAGRGGAGFPTSRKLRAVRAGRRAVVVANGTEGEPASHKDKVLMRLNPHLVIDGALLAAEVVCARRVILAVGRDGDAASVMQAAIDARPDAGAIELTTVPERFVAGEESALVHHINGGEAKPTYASQRVFEAGVGGRPTLVANVETLANLALLARHGTEWFRSTGTEAEPGSVLATVGGCVRMPGVIEAPIGTGVSELLARCGGLTEPAQAYLIGGYSGAWVPADDRLMLSNASLASSGGSLGARALVVLGEGSCGVLETARVIAYMAGQSAEQCGPCVFGLRTLAARMSVIARVQPGAAEAYGHLSRLHRQIARRGACAHPDGVLRFAASATQVFAEEFSAHLAGRCTAHSHAPVLPVPTSRGDWR
jgi:NADH:ubiquinone oxidoreductase subunit F (NADH-binding)